MGHLCSFLVIPDLSVSNAEKHNVYLIYILYVYLSILVNNKILPMFHWVSWFYPAIRNEKLFQKGNYHAMLTCMAYPWITYHSLNHQILIDLLVERTDVPKRLKQWKVLVVLITILWNWAKWLFAVCWFINWSSVCNEFAPKWLCFCCQWV